MSNMRYFSNLTINEKKKNIIIYIHMIYFFKKLNIEIFHCCL